MEHFFKTLIKLLEDLIKFIFNFLEVAITSIPQKQEGYNATFAWAGSLLSGSYTGFCLTGNKNLSAKLSFQNALVMGGTGTGKSSVVLIPSLFTMQGSFVIHDPSGELFSRSSGYLKQKGYDVKVINFAKPEYSSYYNPLERANSSSDIQKVSNMLVENALGGKSKDPFWNTQATALLAMLITILKKQEPEYRNLFNVRQLLNRLGGDPESVDKLFVKDADEVLFAEYKSFLSYDDKVISGIIATCKAALQKFSDESIAIVTSEDNIDFQQFRDKPTALFIQNPVSDQKYYAILTSIFFEQLFTFVLSRFPKEEEQNIFLLIDEASSLNLPTLPISIANVRKHRTGIMLLVQDFSQLVHHYGKNDADGIKSNCFTKMYFTGATLETARELEQVLGKYQYEDEKKHTVVRSLLTNDEIRTMKENRAILICGNHKPIFAKLRPYYKRMRFRAYSQLEEADIMNETIKGDIPILPAKGKQTLADNETTDEQEDQ